MGQNYVGYNPQKNLFNKQHVTVYEQPSLKIMAVNGAKKTANDNKQAIEG